MREDRTLAKDSDLNYFCNATNQAVSQIFSVLIHIAYLNIKFSEVPVTIVYTKAGLEPLTTDV